MNTTATFTGNVWNEIWTALELPLGAPLPETFRRRTLIYFSGCDPICHLCASRLASEQRSVDHDGNPVGSDVYVTDVAFLPLPIKSAGTRKCCVTRCQRTIG